MSTPNSSSRGARDDAPRGERGDYDNRGGSDRRDSRNRGDDRSRGDRRSFGGGGRDDRSRGGFRGDRDSRGFRDRDDRGPGGRSYGRDDRGGRDFRSGRDDRAGRGSGGGRDFRDRDDRRSFGGGRDDRDRGGFRGDRDGRGAGERSYGRGPGGGRDDRGPGGRSFGRDDRAGRGSGGGRDFRDRDDRRSFGGDRDGRGAGRRDDRGGRDFRSGRDDRGNGGRSHGRGDRDDRRSSGGGRRGGAPAGGHPSENQLSKAARERLNALRADYDPRDEDRDGDEGRDTYTDVEGGIRLQKALAAAGVASRRASEEMIAAGRVSVDGQVVRRFGARVNPETSEIRVDGMRVVTAPDKLYFALNKPRGVVSTMWDPEGRPTLADYTGQTEERIFHVGRLDTETEGLILLTNDGELANRLTHPRYKVVKTYIAKVPGPVPHRVVREIEKGVELEDGPVEVDSFRVVENEPPKALVEIRLHEGRKHIVRRLMEAVGHPVADLARTQVGPIDLNTLKLGTMRALTSREVSELYEAAGL
ncbi:pseudouridine synthase [Nocardiopsis sp. FR4]|uniref:pseudouridine synthase n=1 Tax=Nocardiopsis sp. FR4 TaxID=2605985 RepID=UPI0013575367|nr:pseudouridine synthase [Nocardiopsis sp. FR4]